MFDVYFGAPGSGKSTMACRLALQSLKKGVPVFSNVEVKGCYMLDPRADIGKYNITNALVIIDECGIEFSNRDFKTFTKEQNKWFKLYRHARCDIVIFSQSYEDMDKKLRLLANRYFLVERSLIPRFIRVRRITKKIAINDTDRQIIDAYDFVPFSRRLYFGPLYWKYFDSYAMPSYPSKDWQAFGGSPGHLKNEKKISSQGRKVNAKQAVFNLFFNRLFNARQGVEKAVEKLLKTAERLGFRGTD